MCILGVAQKDCVLVVTVVGGCVLAGGPCALALRRRSGCKRADSSGRGQGPGVFKGTKRTYRGTIHQQLRTAYLQFHSQSHRKTVKDIVHSRFPPFAIVPALPVLQAFIKQTARARLYLVLSSTDSDSVQSSRVDDNEKRFNQDGR